MHNRLLQKTKSHKTCEEYIIKQVLKMNIQQSNLLNQKELGRRPPTDTAL